MTAKALIRLWMHKLIRVFAVCMCLKTRFRMSQPIYETRPIQMSTTEKTCGWTKINRQNLSQNPLKVFLQCSVDMLSSIEFNYKLYITKTRLFKYIDNFTSKKWKLSQKKIRYFSYFCSRHRLWVPVRTTSVRWF